MVSKDQFIEKIESKRKSLIAQKNEKVQEEIANILTGLDMTKISEEDFLNFKQSAKNIAEQKIYPEDYKLRILDNIQKNALENHFGERMYSDKLFHTFSDISNDIVYQRMLERGDIQNANLFLERKLTIYDYIDYLTPDEIEQFGLVNVYLAKNVKEGSNIDDKLNLRSGENTTTQKSEPDSNPNNNANSEILPSQKLDELIKELQINHKKLSGIILNPDISQGLTIGSNKGFEKVKMKTDKIVLFFNILKELGMLDGVVLFSGDTPINTIRNSGYYAIFVPKVNKTIFISYEYGEATYICNGLVSIKQMTTFGKKELQSRLNAKKIKFSESNVNQWKYLIKQALGQNQENINISTYDTQINKQIIAHQIREKYKSLPEEDKLNIEKRISSKSIYEDKKNGYGDEIEKVFGEKGMRTYYGLISKLLGDTKTTCRSKEYILALFESEESGREFLEKWKKEQEEKMSIEIIDAELLRKQYWSLSDKDKQIFNQLTGSHKTYNSKKLNELFSGKLQGKIFPKDISGLINLLGGNRKSCMQHGYLEALLISEEEGEKYLERWEKQKNKGKEQNDKFRLKENEIRRNFKALSTDDQKKVFKCLSDENLYQGDLSSENSILRHILGIGIGEEIPYKSIRGFLGLLGGNAECRTKEYLYALFESQEAGKQYFDKRKKEKEENEKRLMDAESIFESYQNMTSKDRLYVDNYFDSHNKTTYNAEDLNPYFCKGKWDGKSMPKTLSGLIKALGGGSKYHSGGYVKSLLNNEGEGFITRITHIENLQKKLNDNYIRNWYKNLTTEERESINRSSYDIEIKKGKEGIFGKYFGEDFEGLPKSYNSLITRLGGASECTKIEYLYALFESQEAGKQYFDERKKEKEEKEKSIMNTQSILESYQSMDDNERKKIIRYFEKCSQTTYDQKIVNNFFCIGKREGKIMPSYLGGLINMLGGNDKCCRGKYVIALLNGNGEKFLKKWEIYMKKNKALTGEKIKNIFKNLNDTQKNEIYSCLTSHAYKENLPILKKYFGKGIPLSLQAFISKLGGDSKIQQKDYIISLLNQDIV